MERDSVNWPRGEGLSNESFAIIYMSNPDSQHTVGFHAARFALRNSGLAEKPWIDFSRPFQDIMQLNETSDCHFRTPNCLPEGPVASSGSASLAGSWKILMQRQEILHLLSIASSTSELSSIAIPPYTCIIRYSMTPSLFPPLAKPSVRSFEQFLFYL